MNDSTCRCWLQADQREETAAGSRPREVHRHSARSGKAERAYDVPVGNQSGLPSLLDYPLSSQGIISSSSLIWTHFSDHAINVTYVNAPMVFVRPRPKPTWQYRNWDHAVDFFKQIPAASLHEWSHFTECIGRLQATTGTSLTCAQKRRLREPENIKELRQAVERHEGVVN